MVALGYRGSGKSLRADPFNFFRIDIVTLHQVASLVAKLEAPVSRTLTDALSQIFASNGKG